MKIVQGEYTQKAVFYKDPTEGWTAGGLNGPDAPPAYSPRRNFSHA